MLMQLRIWIAVCLCVAGILLAGCGQAPAAKPREGPPVVVTSIYPLASLIGELMDSVGTVQSLLPAGRSPHGADLSALQAATLSNADVVIVVGLGLDRWAEAMAHDITTHEVRVFRVAKLLGIDDPHAHDHDEHEHHDHSHHDHAGAVNAHLWLDPVLMDQFTAALAVQLAQRWPEHADKISANAARLHEQLVALDAQHQQQLASVPRRQLVTFHNAFDLLAARYGLTVVKHLADVDLAPGGEVTPARLHEAITTIREHKLKVIYAEPQFPQRAVQALSDETGVRIMRLDPQGDPNIAGYRTYVEMMQSNLATLVEGQSLP